MLGNIKKKFARKNSNPTSSTSTSTHSIIMNRKSTPGRGVPPLSNNPFGSSSPATRRPGKSYQNTLLHPAPDSHFFADRPGMNAFTTPSNEPPPAYTPAPQAAPMQSLATAAQLPTDDRYAFLSSFDTIFLIDDSGSMAGRSWRETGKALETITPICTAHDADGIDIYFLNNPDSTYYRNVTTPATVTEIFTSVRPMGGTPTGQRLSQILRPYLQEYQAAPESAKPKPINIIVITDGEPSDDVESPIIAAAKKLDKYDAPAWQVGIQFFQVGKEPGAKEHLKQLDDELADISGEEDLRDIVDTVPFTGAEGTELTADGILKVSYL
jgi:von Willebrand factor type A domain